jgi:hypothetical protein
MIFLEVCTYGSHGFDEKQSIVEEVLAGIVVFIIPSLGFFSLNISLDIEEIQPLVARMTLVGI